MPLFFDFWLSEDYFPILLHNYLSIIDKKSNQTKNYDSRNK